jgi:predicted branched-subunit amino acid permease
MLHSASVHLKHLNRRWKLLLSYLLTDEAFALTIAHYNQTPSLPADPSNKHWYFLGAGTALWSAWQASTAAGILLGAQIPDSWALDFTLALTFIALVVPMLHDRPSLAAALSAGVVAVVGADWPYKLGLMAAATSGIVIGLLVEAWQSSAGRNERAAP